jgi:hypothetical protein
MNFFLTPQSYEALVEDVCRQLAGNMDAKIHRNVVFPGASGHSHQIDVAVDIEVKGLRLLVLIECKWWRKRVGVQEVMVLLQRLQDIGAHKGVIVSSVGFQKGAIKMAKAKGVALVILKGSAETIVMLNHCHSSSLGEAESTNIEEVYSLSAGLEQPAFLFTASHGDKARIHDIKPCAGSPYGLVTADDGGCEPIFFAQLIGNYSHSLNITESLGSEESVAPTNGSSGRLTSRAEPQKRSTPRRSIW